MKKYLVVLLMMTMAVSLAACGGKDKKEEKEIAVEETEKEVEKETEKKVEAEETKEEVPEAAAFTPVSGEWEGYTYTVVGAEQFIDSEGKDAIRVYYDFYNNSEETENAYGGADFYVEQDGYEAEYTYAPWDADVAEGPNESLRVRPGACIRCVAEYFMKPDGGPLTFSIFNYYDETQRVDVQFDPQNLPGAPADPLEMATIADPQFLTDWPDEAVYDEEFYVLIDTAEVVEGDNGEQLLRVYYEFTNNSAEAENMWFNVTINVYQDGIECPEGDPAVPVEEDTNYRTDVEPGGKLRTSACYVINGTSNVEVEIEDIWTGTGIGAIFEIY